MGPAKYMIFYQLEAVVKMKIENPDALLIAHPECKAMVLELADFIGSTTAMLDYTIKSNSKKFIVATETGILHQMKKYSPDKEFLIVPTDETCSCNDCPYMKMNTLEKLYLCLKNEKPEIKLSEDIIKQAGNTHKENAGDFKKYEFDKVMKNFFILGIVILSA